MKRPGPFDMDKGVFGTLQPLQIGVKNLMVYTNYTFRKWVEHDTHGS